MAVYLIFSEPILALFGAANESAYYTDFTVKCFRMYLCLMPLATLNKGTFIYLQALGKAFASTAVSMTREILFVPPCPFFCRFSSGWTAFSGPSRRRTC